MFGDEAQKGDATLWGRAESMDVDDLDKLIDSAMFQAFRKGRSTKMAIYELIECYYIRNLGGPSASPTLPRYLQVGGDLARVALRLKTWFLRHQDRRGRDPPQFRMFEYLLDYRVSAIPG
jgi:hypothetical protein